MKKIILALLSVAILIGAGLITLAIVYKYENVKEEKAQQIRQEQADINRTVAQAKWALEGDITKLTQEYNTLHAECVKGAAAYPLLTAANKAKVQNPACGLAK